MKNPGKMIGEVLRSIWRKPATILYPRTKIRMPEHFRGKLKFDPSKCIGCQMCVRDCPTGAIKIVKVGDKQFEAHIDLSACIYCGQCVDSCPKGALETTPEFELAGLRRDQLKVVFHAAKANAPEAKDKEPGAQPQDGAQAKT